MTKIDIFFVMMEDLKQALAEHTKLTAQRDEMMQKKIDSLMLQIKEEINKMQEQELLNNELKAEIKLQKMLINEKEKKIQEQEVLLNQMEIEQSDLISEIESQKLHMNEKDKMITDQSDMIQDQAEMISNQEKCIKNQEIKCNRLRMENEGIRLKNNIAKREIDELTEELKASFKRMRMTSIRSIESQQKYLQIKELYQKSQQNWVDAIDVYFKQIESMNEYIETLHAGSEDATMLQLIEQAIEEGTEQAQCLSPIPEEDEDAYEESDDQETAESNEAIEDNENIFDVNGQEIFITETEVTENEDVVVLETVEMTEDDHNEYNDGASTSNDVINFSKDAEAEISYSACNSNVELICNEKFEGFKDEGIEIITESNLSNADSNAGDIIHGSKQDSGLYVEECEKQIDSYSVEVKAIETDNVQAKADELQNNLNDNNPKAPKKKSKKRGGQKANNKRSKQKYVPFMEVANY
ncbi:hypothetical protein ACKWTF_011486 [Chironomus riparius]